MKENSETINFDENLKIKYSKNQKIYFKN